MIPVDCFDLGVLVGIVFTVCVLVWEHGQPVVDVVDGIPLPCEPLGVRHDRLDAEARVAAYGATVVPKPRPHGAGGVAS